MTEIPEHLLQRSRARKGGGDDAAAGSGGGGAVTPAAESAPASAGPPALVAAAAAVPADKPAAPAPPDPPHIAAAKARKRMPMWAMGLVAALPVWALSYAGTMQQPEVEDPLYVEAAAVYAAGGCAGCHGATGGGGTGYAFAGGEIIATFPSPIDHMVHVARGSQAISGEAYGDPERAGGQRVSGARGSGAMPAQIGALTALELELVVFHERIVLGGDDPASPENAAWVESLREEVESHDGAPIDLDALLACADPAMTPGATGGGTDCPGGGEE